MLLAGACSCARAGAPFLGPAGQNEVVANRFCSFDNDCRTFEDRVYCRCRSCQTVVARGCLPTVSCGVLASMYLGFGGGISLVIGVRIWRHYPWWATALAAPFLLILTIALILFFAYTFQFIEWLIVRLTHCPSCRRRRWSRGYTKGFGL